MFELISIYIFVLFSLYHIEASIILKLYLLIEITGGVISLFCIKIFVDKIELMQNYFNHSSIIQI